MDDLLYQNRIGSKVESLLYQNREMKSMIYFIKNTREKIVLDYIRLRETFITSYIVERINKAELRPEEQNEKAKGCREKLWNKIQLKGP